MPYASAAQARLFHAKAKTSKVWAKRAAHWDAATHAQGGIGKAKEPDYRGAAASRTRWRPWVAPRWPVEPVPG